MMTPADGFQNNCGTFTNNILIDECRGDVVILKEFHVYFSVKISIADFVSLMRFLVLIADGFHGGSQVKIWTS